MKHIRKTDRNWTIGLIHARKHPAAWWGSASNANDLIAPVVQFGQDLGVTVSPFVSEYEPEVAQFIYDGQDAFIVNPATHTLYGETIRSALAGYGKPFIEVHALNLSKWLSERPSRQSHLESNFSHDATGLVTGMGIYGYYGALLSLVGILDGPEYLG